LIWHNCQFLVCQTQLSSDLSRCLGIDFPARQRGEPVTDIHHGVTAFALAIINPKAETLTPDFRNEAVSFVRFRAAFTAATIGQFCPNVNPLGQKGPISGPSFS
jgi:hypothetical protein